MRRAISAALSAVVLAGAVLLAAPAAQAAELESVIDFESGLSPGDQPTTLSVGNGMSGADLGTVGVYGFEASLALANAAMIFDATCGGLPGTDGQPPSDPSACTGDDPDLYYPSFGNVLIVSEDNDTTDPGDSNRFRSRLDFDFTGWHEGSVTIKSFDVLDIEIGQPAFVRLYPSNTDILIGDTGGDNQAKTVPVNVDGVTAMSVYFRGSGAVDNIRISVQHEEQGGQGCTPGYWRQPHHFGSWVDYRPTDSFSAVFGVSYSKTLLQSVKAGGGGQHALARHAVAALLNSTNPDVSYEYSTAEVISLVQSAFATGNFEPTKDLLEAQNEMGCPLGRSD